MPANIMMTTCPNLTNQPTLSSSVMEVVFLTTITIYHSWMVFSLTQAVKATYQTL